MSETTEFQTGGSEYGQVTVSIEGAVRSSNSICVSCTCSRDEGADTAWAYLHPADAALLGHALIAAGRAAIRANRARNQEALADWKEANRGTR